MAHITGDLSNCGMKGIHYLSVDPVQNLLALFNGDECPWAGYNLFYFSDSDENSKAVQLAKYIRENNLGVVIESQKVNNPVHGNEVNPWLIQAFFWHPDHEALDKWKKSLGKPKDVFDYEKKPEPEHPVPEQPKAMEAANLVKKPALRGAVYPQYIQYAANRRTPSKLPWRNLA